MSSIAWSTVVVVVLLTPGLLTVVGMYLPLKVSRDVVPQTGLAQLAYGACASALLHALALLLVRLLSSRGIVPSLDLAQILAISELTRHRSALDLTGTLLYEGLLDQVYLRPEGTISYLTILNCTRFYLMLEGEAPLPTAADLHRPVVASFPDIPMSQLTDDFLFIPGEQIRDVVFEPHQYGRSATGRRLLERKLQSLARS